MTMRLDQYASTAEEITRALLALDGARELPLEAVSIRNTYGLTTAYLYPPRDYVNVLASVLSVAQWAAVLGVDVVLSLGEEEGKVRVRTNVAGYKLEINTSIGCAQAYELGVALGRPLDEQHQGLTLTATDLITACETASVVA